jgi:hypothetical protein
MQHLINSIWRDKKANALVERCNSFLWRVARGCKHHYIVNSNMEGNRKRTNTCGKIDGYEEEVIVAMVVQVLQLRKNGNLSLISRRRVAGGRLKDLYGNIMMSQHRSSLTTRTWNLR